MPAGQGVHALSDGAPIVPEYVPALHAVQVALLVAATVDEYRPAPHAMQVLLLLAPTVEEYVPAGHGKHCVVEFEYVPAEQG